ncbi:MAG: imidazole glycerol phosphate synthase subunit HisH [Phycisphaerales bacterium]|nr:imidazole glycerol phosphate synthase subunit HisH [Phycisphaerales bacterium]
MLAIIDYGMANLRSVQKAFERMGYAAQIISTPEQVQSADQLIVPGVGAFQDAMKVLNATDLTGAIKDFAKTGKPLLGICLGLQLFTDLSEEDGLHQGLGLIVGKVVRFTVDRPPYNLKVPHMGWNALHPTPNTPLFKNLPADSHVYFVHSYHLVPADPAVIAATADYGPPFVAAITQNNILATQFHPEKSQQVGAQILKNFAEFKP